MSLFRKKPVIVEAFQWTGGAEAATPIIEWILQSGGTARYHEERWTDTSFRETKGGIEEKVETPRTEPVPAHIAIDTLEGTMRCTVNDYVIKGVQGEFYPCKPDIMEETYESAWGVGTYGGSAVPEDNSARCDFDWCETCHPVETPAE